MEQIKFLVLCFVFLCSNAQLIGFKTTLSLNGISYLKDVGLKVLEQQLNTISIPDISGETDTPVGHIHYTLSSIVMQNLVIPSSSASLDPSTSVQLNIGQVAAQMHMNWHYRQDGFPHVSDSGSADVDVSSTSMGVQIDVAEKGGLPVATVTNFNVSIGHLDIKVHGGASWLYNIFISAFSGSITSATESALKSQVPQAIDQGLASAIKSLPTTETISRQVEINFELEAAPYVTPNYLTIATRGEFYDVQNPTEAPFKPASMPDTVTSEMAQMFVSDFSVNSASYVIYNQKKMQIMITDSMLPANAPLRLNTTYFTDLIPGFATAYPNQMFDLWVAASEVPITTFSSDGAFVVANGILQAIMPNKTIAWTLAIKVYADGTAALSSLNITGQLKFVNLTLAFDNSTFGPIDVTALNQIAGSLVTMGLIPQANKILGAGFPLPTVQGLQFLSPSIGWGQNYLYVSTDVTYSPPALSVSEEPDTKTKVNVV